MILSVQGTPYNTDKCLKRGVIVMDHFTYGTNFRLCVARVYVCVCALTVSLRLLCL